MGHVAHLGKAAYCDQFKFNGKRVHADGWDPRATVDDVTEEDEKD